MPWATTGWATTRSASPGWASAPDPRGREVVSVAIGDRTVGWLTPRMTERFRPAVEAAQADGRHLTAAATLEPSRRKSHESEIDVVVRVPKGWGRTDARPQ